MSFQMKGKRYKIKDVIDNVVGFLNRANQSKLDTIIHNNYNNKATEILDNNPNWRVFANTKEEFLKQYNVSLDTIKQEVYGELIMQGFNCAINRRVRSDRAYAKDINSLVDISPEVLEHNLNIIRGMRKHQIGMRYNK